MRVGVVFTVDSGGLAVDRQLQYQVLTHLVYDSIATVQVELRPAVRSARRVPRAAQEVNLAWERTSGECG